MVDLDAGLSGAELDELEALLGHESFRGRAMNPAMIEGLAAALIVGPGMAMPSRWMPWVWDREIGEQAPGFDSLTQANHLMGLVTRHYNAVALAFKNNPDSFVPLFQENDRWSAEDWCGGFIVGLQFAEPEWDRLMDEQLAWFTPFIMLGGDEEISADDIEQGYVERWKKAIAPTLVRMQAYWRERRDSRPAGIVRESFPLGGQRAPTTRSVPKVGRNDPCPCGSGLKFKKCCGTAPTQH